MQVAPAPRCASASPTDRNRSPDLHPSSPCCLFFLFAAIYPPGRWPDNCSEPTQTSPSSRGLNVGRGTDVGPRFTIAKESICNTRGAAEEHPAVYCDFWSVLLHRFGVCESPQKCESKSRHGPADFRHAGSCSVRFKSFGSPDFYSFCGGCQGSRLISPRQEE
jgi:hypothetical protein